MTHARRCRRTSASHAFRIFDDVGRFAVNTTIGVAGFFDPATNFGIHQSDEDFGQTLGWWGVGTGPYLVLPVFGASTARDTVGLAANWPMAESSRMCANLERSLRKTTSNWRATSSNSSRFTPLARPSVFRTGRTSRRCSRKLAKVAMVSEA